jgi:hypothetical protein
MSIFNEPETADERKLRLDNELAFRIVARRNKLLGIWAAGHMGLTGEDAARYALSLVEAELAERDDEAIVRKVCDDLVARGFPIVERDVRRQLQEYSGQARAEIMTRGRR